MAEDILRILFVEDNPDDVLLLSRLIQKDGWQLAAHRVETAADFARQLREGCWDLTIVDYTLPGFNGREALRIFREMEVDIPFILVSGTIGEELAVEMMKAGANDYIMKNNLPRIVPAIRRELAEADNRRRRHEIEARCHALAEMVASAEVGIIGLDMDGIVTSCNTGAEKILGLCAPKAVGRALGDVITPVPEREGLADLTKAFQEGRRIAGQEVVADTERGIVHLVATVSPIMDNQPYPIGISLIFNDITMQRRAELALHDSERWMMVTLNSLGTGIVVIDPELHRIVDVNAAAADLLGLPKVQLLGASCPGRICGHRLEDCPISRGERIDHTEDYLPRGDGHRVPVLKTVAETELGGRRLLVASFIDITALRQAESQKRELEQQIQMARRLQGLGLMAGTVAHDFGNFLQVILGNLDILLGILPEKGDARICASEARTVAQRASELCHQLTGCAGKAKAVPVATDLNQPLREAVETLVPGKPSQVDLQLKLSGKPIEVPVDMVQVRQAAINLIANAIQAISSQGGQVIVSVGLQEVAPETVVDPWNQGWLPPGRYACITVRDNGCGMDEDTAARIFDPFFTTKPEGRGLGLAALPGIMHCHRGGFRIVTAPGQGTEFSLLFPLA